MAKATIGIVNETVQTVVTKEVISLELSREEAQFVLNYLGHTVTGNVSGLRKHSDDVCDALRNAGVTYDDDFHTKVEGVMKHNHFRGIQGGC